MAAFILALSVLGLSILEFATPKIRKLSAKVVKKSVGCEMMGRIV